MFLRLSHISVLAVFVLGLLGQPSHAGLDQFDVSSSPVDLQEFMSGGPSKEGIPFLDRPFDERIGGQEIQIRLLKGGAVEAVDKNGNIHPSVVAYWFAWSFFHRDTLVFDAQGGKIKSLLSGKNAITITVILRRGGSLNEESHLRFFTSLRFAAFRMTRFFTS